MISNLFKEEWGEKFEKQFEEELDEVLMSEERMIRSLDLLDNEKDEGYTPSKWRKMDKEDFEFN